VVLVMVVVAAGVACRRPPTQQPPPTQATTPGSTEVHTKKVKYGPYTVPNVNAPGQSPLGNLMQLVGATLEDGMLSEPIKDVEKPCEDCYITRMQAGLEYTDGSDANISKGMWLHHMVALDTGTGKSDATCASAPLSLPHTSFFDQSITAKTTERFFASGNERTVVDLTRSASYGYRVNRGDRFHLLIELMNLTPTDTPVFLTVEYRYVAGNAAGYRPVKPVWLDAVNCGTSEAPARTGQYSLASRPWTSTVTGTLVTGIGHLHDGGTRLTYDTGGRVFCTSDASYGTKPEYVDPPGGGMDHGDGGMDHGHGGSHISEMTLCPPGTPIRAGDVLTAKGYYDDAAHPQMMHAGKAHAVMALGILYYSQ
jgi:hypothetical protein